MDDLHRLRLAPLEVGVDEGRLAIAVEDIGHHHDIALFRDRAWPCPGWRGGCRKCRCRTTDRDAGPGRAHKEPRRPCRPRRRFPAFFRSFLLPFINHGIPITHPMRSGAGEAAPAQLPADHGIEIAMRHQRRAAALRAPCRSGCRRPGRRDAWLCGNSRSRDDSPHAREPCAITAHFGTRIFKSGMRGLASGASANRGSATSSACGASALRAFMRARPVGGENMVQFLHQIGEFLRRQAGRVQARGFIGVDIVAKAVMAGARTERQGRLAMAHQNDARALGHGGRFRIRHRPWENAGFCSTAPS